MAWMEAAHRKDRERFERERDRARAAEVARLRAAARRPVGENLEEGLRLIDFAQQFQAGFRGHPSGGS